MNGFCCFYILLDAIHAYVRNHLCLFLTLTIFDISGDGITHLLFVETHMFTFLCIASVSLQIELKHFFFLMAGEYLIICMFHNLFNHSPLIDIWVASKFLPLQMLSNFVNTSVRTCANISEGEHFRSGTAGLKGMLQLNKTSLGFQKACFRKHDASFL